MAVILNLSSQADAQDHSAWTALLSHYVKPHEDGVSRFDYARLKDTPEDLELLADYIASYSDLDMDGLGEKSRFAAYVNAYNALTVQHIIGRYPVKSIRDGYFIGPWKRVKMKIDGRLISLDAIEHEVLRKMFDEPRVHYALNCASIGCPNLMDRAWLAETLEADLDAAARAYINHPRGVTIRSSGGLELSSIYNWFREDFGDGDAAVIDHLLAHAQPALASEIRANQKIKSYQYDWSLNDTGETK